MLVDVSSFELRRHAGDLSNRAELGPLVMHGLVRRWRLKGPAAVRLEDLDALPETLAPERLAFRAERAQAVGDVEAAKALIAQVRALGVGSIGGWTRSNDGIRGLAPR